MTSVRKGHAKEEGPRIATTMTPAPRTVALRPGARMCLVNLSAHRVIVVMEDVANASDGERLDPEPSPPPLNEIEKMPLSIVVIRLHQFSDCPPIKDIGLPKELLSRLCR